MLEYLATMETADDRTRFESLYLAYRGLMYHVAYHILKNPQDAEDAVHQSFVKLAEHMATIPDGPCPRTRNLVVTVAERKAIDLYRSRQRHPETELDEQTVWSAPPEGGGLADAMASLPPRYREVLLLKYYNGYSAREIAGFLVMGHTKRNWGTLKEAVLSAIKRYLNRNNWTQNGISMHSGPPHS